jgi:hypothetical protein
MNVIARIDISDIGGFATQFVQSIDGPTYSPGLHLYVHSLLYSSTYFSPLQTLAHIFRSSSL